MKAPPHTPLTQRLRSSGSSRATDHVPAPNRSDLPPLLHRATGREEEAAMAAEDEEDVAEAAAPEVEESAWLAERRVSRERAAVPWLRSAAYTDIASDTSLLSGKGDPPPPPSACACRPC